MSLRSFPSTFPKGDLHSRQRELNSLPPPWFQLQPLHGRGIKKLQGVDENQEGAWVAVLAPGGTSQKVRTRAQQEAEEERRKAGKEKSLPRFPALAMAPARRAACPCRLAARRHSTAPAAAAWRRRICWITPVSTSYPPTEGFNVVSALWHYLFRTKRAGQVRKTCCWMFILAAVLFLSLFLVAWWGLSGHCCLLGSSCKCFCRLD